MDARIYFGKVYIIGWLSPEDAKTGWELYEELQPIGIMSKPQVDVSFQRVQTRAEFIAYLRAIAVDFRATKKLPLLHLETHGLEVDGQSAGICSSAADAVLWPELMSATDIATEATESWRILSSMSRATGANPEPWAPIAVVPITAAPTRDVISLMGLNTSAACDRYRQQEEKPYSSPHAGRLRPCHLVGLFT